MLHSQILIFFIFLVLYSKQIMVSLKKKTLQKKVVIVEEELDGIDIDDNWNFDEESENLRLVNDGEEFTRIIN